MDETRATARLPGLDIDVARRQTADGEEIRIALRARPSFAALLPFNPFLAWLSFNPFLAWSLRAAEVRPVLPPPDREEG